MTQKKDHQEPRGGFSYRGYEKKKLILVISALILAIILVLLDITSGEKWIPLTQVLQSIFQPDAISEVENLIIKSVRLPKTFMAMLSGIALGLSGGIVQTVLNNKLASPYTLGLSSAAGLGASIAITTGLSAITGIGMYLVPLTSFTMTFIACLFIYFFGNIFNSRPDTMILGGIGLTFVFQAAQSVLQYSATAEQNQNIVFWLFGSLSRSNWLSVFLLGAGLLICMPWIMKDSWRLTALKLGEENAMSLGVDVRKIRFKSFFIVSIVTGITISFIGTVGFIGLVGPHIARLMVGEDQRYYLPISGLCGGIILTFASVMSKVLLPGRILPIGIVTSLIGGPFFIFFIFYKRKKVLGE